MNHFKTTNSNFQSGQTIVIVALFFSAVSATILLVLAEPALKQLAVTANLQTSQQSLYLAKAAGEDYIYRLTNNLPVSPTNVLTIGSDTGSATLQTSGADQYIIASGNSGGLVRNIKYHLVIGVGTSFHYGLQAGTGGITLRNTSSVEGNVYANGPVVGEGNYIRGTVVSAGPFGWVWDIHATSSTYANTIQDATIDGDAYYTSISGSTVSGTLNPGSPDQPPAPFPISDSQISEWETDAEAGGIISSPCPYKIATDLTLGPKRIDCDVEIKGVTLTLTGPIWIKGNLDANTFTKIKVAPSLGSKSVVIIVDNPSNHTTSSKVSLGQSGNFSGSGIGNSYVLIISQNNSAETGGVGEAISVAQNIEGDLLVYAAHGLIALTNSIILKEVTAYKIYLFNSAIVKYESGIASLLFSAGPGGSYEYDWYRETQ